MDNLDEDEFGTRPAPTAREDEFGARPAPAARTFPLSLMLRLAAAGVALLLLWMTLGLFSQVATLEGNINTLQQDQSRISKQLDSVIQALANHLKPLEMSSTESQGTLSTPPPPKALPPRTIPSPPALSRKLPIQPVAEQRAPAAPAKQSRSNQSLPAPISRADVATGKSSSSGAWVINITSVSNPESADQEVTRLQGMGIKAESSRAVSKGKVWYRVRVAGFGSHDEANAARPSLETQLGIHDTWVGQQE